MTMGPTLQSINGATGVVRARPCNCHCHGATPAAKHASPCSCVLARAQQPTTRQATDDGDDDDDR